MDNIEQQLHHGFVGRDEICDELTNLLLHDPVDRCVALVGGTGTGKTAIVTRWAAQHEAGQALVFCHFVRRWLGDRAEPWLIARSLADPIEQRFPHLRDPQARPEARLNGLLARVASRELREHGRRMVLIVDGIDDGSAVLERRAALSCLPRQLPGGVRLLLAGQLRDPVRELAGRHGQITALDLDAPQLAGDNEATVRALWQREADALGLDAAFTEHAIRCANGNLLHARLWCRHIAGAVTQRQTTGVPRDLAALIAALWQRASSDRAGARVLEILCAAREPLAADQIGRVAGWSDPSDLRAALQLARDLVAITQRADRAPVHAPIHDLVRRFIVERIGAIAHRGHHHELADKLASWPAPRDPVFRRYALRHAIGHCTAAADYRAAHALATNLDFLAAKCSELGLDDVELDVRRAADACVAAGHMSLHGDLDRLIRALASESSSLPRGAGADTGRLWERIRQRDRTMVSASAPRAAEPPAARAPVGELPAATKPSAPAGVRSGLLGPAASRPQATMLGAPAAPAEVSHAPVRGRPALLGAMVSGGGAVTACAVTPDGRRVVAAYADRTLKLWELETRKLLRTMAGHAGAIEACAITPNGSAVVSASADKTLKLWDLTTGELLATFEGHRGAVRGCAITRDGANLVSASADTTLKLWNLTTGELVTTFEGHTGAVRSCAITHDGTGVISGSSDTTLRLWSLGVGEIASLRGHGDAVTDCAVMPGGRRVVSSSADHTLRVWDIVTGCTTTSLKGHTGPVTSCVVAPDRRSVYSASQDTTLKIWDVDTGRVVTTLEGHGGAVTCCAVTPDGRRLISGSSDTTLRIWALDGRTVRPPTPHTTAPHKPNDKLRILFLAANTRGKNLHILEEEYAAIERELQLARHGSAFELISKWALTVDDMARHLLDLDPAIVHFRGQGRGDPEAGDTDPDSGIYLPDERQKIQRVNGRALKMMVGSSAPSARVVVLNACYSDEHADELCQVVECVVGMSRDHDHAARSFAMAFYRALGHRRSVGDAVEHAVATLAARDLPDDCVPRCRTRNWIDPHDITPGPSAS